MNVTCWCHTFNPHNGGKGSWISEGDISLAYVERSYLEITEQWTGKQLKGCLELSSQERPPFLGHHLMMVMMVMGTTTMMMMTTLVTVTGS